MKLYGEQSHHYGVTVKVIGMLQHGTAPKALQFLTPVAHTNKLHMDSSLSIIHTIYS